MPWVFMSEDNPEKPELRSDQALMDAHRAYELSIKEKTLCAGSLRSDEGGTPISRMLILDVESRDEAERLFNDDPATKSGLRANVMVKRWKRAIFGGEVAEQPVFNALSLGVDPTPLHRRPSCRCPAHWYRGTAAAPMPWR